ncbi:Rrf2 family transcriptional regulator [Hyphobacterium marinum]|uniref:Rrf2 family transcriptional regulator n=1 Tax=Hyphobacterium marinum TaxID=3116574 RepID=A0ABU7M0G0_9PROT|nr:Rrf2 family transcriptional regulator [Hyphobacterium sp. Y6023]MEE2567268.1 Rrf2 family transcriptional regulator [Hyphobacterium sp. Y6023]
MKLSTKGRYAVMAVADLAAREDGAPVTLADIASRQSISLSYLEQLFAKLRRGGVVKSTRGPGGGYRLSKAAAEIRVSDVIMAVDEPLGATRCGGGTMGCLKTGKRCATHDLWDELGRHVYLFFNSISLADVVEGRVMGAACGGALAPRVEPVRSAREAVPAE